MTNQQKTLTLILAATPSMGIGKNGALPWPMLKKEMAYFARVTKRVVPTSASASSTSDGTTTTSTTPTRPKLNAVIMGRKTWDSIPPRFRPLKDRLNIVITRSPSAFEPGIPTSSDCSDKVPEGPLVSSSLDSALRLLDAADLAVDVQRVFVIGGATIYSAAMELERTRRVLLTKVRGEFECDAFFCEDLGSEGSAWVQRGREETEAWTGEVVREGGEEEKGVEFEFCMFER